ncbi:MAG: gluconeogenesis factor YvcK family protein [Chloroflexota bacterium]
MPKASPNTPRSSGNGPRPSTPREQLRLLLLPDIGLKRWVLAGAVGVLLVALGSAFAVSVSVTSTIVNVGQVLTLGHLLGGVARGAVLIGLGLVLAGIAAYRLNRRLAHGSAYAGRGGNALAGLASHRERSGGPRVVTIGGGTGLSSLLRGLKERTDQVSAIVTVADDGGSSGRLRSELGIPPPGDARQCLVALAESEPLMEQLLAYRFDSEGSLGGHSLGNLLLAALVHTQGDLQGALEAAGQILGVRGRVMPSSLAADLHLMARTVSGRELGGESAVGLSQEAIADIWLVPPGAGANLAAVEAIAQAQLIVLGPGSLYTSLLPNLLIQGIRDAVERARAPKVFVCNIATQHGETDGLSAGEHLRVFIEHTGIRPTHFLVNSAPRPIPAQFQQTPLTQEGPLAWFEGRVVRADVIDEGFPSRHDPRKLAAALFSLP